MKIKIITFFILLNLNSFCQTKYDSTFLRQIINNELKIRDKKINKAYPIFEISINQKTESQGDTLLNKYQISENIDWKTFGLISEFGFYTNNIDIDSCLVIYNPIFNNELNKFEIKFETRIKKDFSFYVIDYYVKKETNGVLQIQKNHINTNFGHI